MATLAAQFSEALSNIEPDEDVANAVTAHHAVRKALKDDDRLRKLGVDPILIGSYKRHVSIKRIKDVDVFARLAGADANLRPGEILDHVAEVLEEAFPGCVEQQRRSVKVEFDEYDLAVDVVIARPCADHPDEHWQIPERTEKEDGGASWVETNPTKMTELTIEANKTYLLDADDDGDGDGIYVPVVKLVRQIRRTWVADHPGGFYLEVLTLQVFNDLDPDEDTVAAYLATVLPGIVDGLRAAAEDGLADPTLEGSVISTKATDEELAEAADRIEEAARLAGDAVREKSVCKAAVMWRRLLGTTKHTEVDEHVFPLPEYCNADGTEKSTSRITTGARTVPAGSDRYA